MAEAPVAERRESAVKLALKDVLEDVGCLSGKNSDWPPSISGKDRRAKTSASGIGASARISPDGSGSQAMGICCRSSRHRCSRQSFEA
jgi:hypothetical protein